MDKRQRDGSTNGHPNPGKLMKKKNKLNWREIQVALWLIMTNKNLNLCNKYTNYRSRNNILTNK